MIYIYMPIFVHKHVYDITNRIQLQDVARVILLEADMRCL